MLFRLLNASGNMGISLALSGHRFIVIALDGNPVPTPATVDVLKLDVAERADVIVEMNNPGVWIFGSTDDDDRNMGMGVVVEYENQSGEPRWVAPPKVDWDYTAFGRSGPAATPDETIKLTFRKSPEAAAAITAGPSTANPGPTPTRYSPWHAVNAIAFMNNNSGDNASSSHASTYVRNNQSWHKATSAVMKDTISMPRYSTAEIDFVADDPGDTLFHCHHQDHMDEGFAGLITYT